ncbi:hypothetical protein ACWGLF_31165 [Streptomyces puniciscabiei]
MTKPIELVIFDCDGVLVGSERIAAQVQAALGEDKVVVARFIGRSPAAIRQQVAERLGQQTAAVRAERFEPLHREVRRLRRTRFRNG